RATPFTPRTPHPRLVQGTRPTGATESNTARLFARRPSAAHVDGENLANPRPERLASVLPRAPAACKLPTSTRALFRVRAGGRMSARPRRPAAITQTLWPPPPPPLPDVPAPMLYTLVDAPFDGPDWTFEPKFDGLPVLARFDGRAVSLLSRNHK